MTDTAETEMSLQILFKRGVAAPQKRSARRKLEKLGIMLTGEGLVTVSGRLSSRAFEQLFGSSSEQGDAVLPIPELLKEQVASISLAPRHLQF